MLGLATGSTPLTIWRSLAGRGLDFSQVRGFALDEYIGLPAGDPRSYRATIDAEVVDVLGLDPALVHVPGDVLDGDLDRFMAAALSQRVSGEIVVVEDVD